MTKGQLVDFFDKATFTMKDGLIEAIIYNSNVKGDKLFVKIDPVTNLFVW